MLKNVVLPAPFGPIRLTIERSGIVKSRSLTARRPPNSLRAFSATSRSGCFGAISALRSSGRLVGPPRLAERGVDRAPACALFDLELATALGDQTDRPEEHHQHDDEAVDPERVLRNIDLDPEQRIEDVSVEPGTDVGEAFDVEPGEDDPCDDDAPEAAHSAQDDHAEQEDRDVEVELARERARIEARDVGAGDSAEEGADRVGPGLRPHQRDAHGAGRGLVFTNRDPGAAESRVAKPQRAEDGHQEDDEHGPEEKPVGVQRLLVANW